MKERYRGLSKEESEKAMKAMQKYGDNHWWESKDPKEIAKHQIFEDVLLTDFGKYLKGLNELTGRPVHVGELSSKRYTEKLKKEVKEASRKSKK